MKMFWRLLWKLNLGCLADAVAMANNSRFAWKMVPCLAHPLQTKNTATSFINGWRARKIGYMHVGWVSELPIDAGESSYSYTAENLNSYIESDL